MIRYIDILELRKEVLSPRSFESGSTHVRVKKPSTKEALNYITISDGKWTSLDGLIKHPRKDDNDLCANSESITKPLIMTTTIIENEGTENEKLLMKCNLCGRDMGEIDKENKRKNDHHRSLIQTHITKHHPKPMPYDTYI